MAVGDSLSYSGIWLAVPNLCDVGDRGSVVYSLVMGCYTFVSPSRYVQASQILINVLCSLI